MKKIFKKIFVSLLVVVLMGTTNVYAETPTLEQIATKFNNNSTVRNYAELGTTIAATASDNALTIVATSDEDSETYVYNLNGTILSTNIQGEDRVFAGLLVSAILTNVVGEFHGYEENELTPTINSDEINNYTVENEGIEVKETAKDAYSFKLDISKKIPLIDVSDVYFTVEDIEESAEYISGDGFAENSKGNVWFHKSGYDGNNKILVAEKNSLTNNSYRTVLSILTVMFESSDAADYFTRNYSGIVAGTKEFKGIKIEVNPTKDDLESRVIPDTSGYDFVRITIDKKEYLAGMNGAKSNSKNNTVENVTGIPDTGRGQAIQFILFGSLFILYGAGSVFYVLTKRTIKQEQ